MSAEDRNQPGTDEVVSLNADKLDAERLDELAEDDLDNVAGGAAGTCGTFTCGTNSAN